MYLRLAFSVAAHLETEILIVDEVLAVGDAAFQKKCLGRIGDVAREGRTVLFVSHNMAAITSLCHRVLLIADGKLEMDGSVSKVALHYQANTFVGSFAGTDVRNSPRKGNGKARFASIIIRPLGASGLPLTVIRTGCDLEIELVIECKGDILESNSAIIIYDAMGYRLIDANTAQEGAFLSLTAGRPVQVRYFIRELLLKPGTYFVGLWLGRGGIEEIDNIEFATSFTVAEDPETTKHTEVFPGPYLCRFEVDLGSAYDRTR
jgi:lipopolysaccharide transport system ATP-binding protein